MNMVFKKYFWAVKLVGIALVALVVAGGINDWVGSKMFAIPTAPNLDEPDGAAGDDVPAWGRVAASEEATATLHARHVFNLNPDVDEEVVVEPVVEPPKVEELKPDDQLEESALAIDLVGTWVDAEATSSMATLQVEGANKLGWVGSEFLEGRAKIVKIAPRHIVIKEETRYTVVKLWSEKGKGGNQPAQPGQPGFRPGGRPEMARPVSPPPIANAVSPSDRTARADRIRDGIKKTGAYDFQVDRKMIDEELKDLAKLQSEARVVPNYQNQKYDGFKLVGVRPGSLYRALGIRSGDVIKSVNGTAIDSPTKALALFEQLKTSSDIKVDVERRGQPKTLSFNIQ